MLQKRAVKDLFQCPKYHFSFTHNLHHPPFFYVNGIKHTYDFDITQYKPQIQAFLQKRWTSKREVPAKVAIMDDMGPQFQQIYQQQKLAPGEFLYDVKTMTRFYESDNITTSFLHAMWTQPYEKPLIEEVLKKRVMNGSVVSLVDKPMHDDLCEQTASWLDLFHNGEKLTPYEVELERMYIDAKLTKHGEYKKRKVNRFKVKWTVSDLNRHQDQKDYRMIDQEYFANPRPTFEPYDLSKALDHLRINQDIQQTGFIRKWISFMTEEKTLDRGSRRSRLVAYQILKRFMLYMDSWEFVTELDLQEDFHIHNSVANMHVWLIYQRLRDFKENKYAIQLSEEIIKTFNDFIKTEMDTVDVLRRHKKLDDIDNYLYAIRKNLDFHFFVNGASVFEPEFKMDALVWTCIFHEKIPRYSDKVYKMSAYLIEHFLYLKTLSFDDIEKGMIDWSANRVPYNCRERFTRIKSNTPLSPEEFEKEYESPYVTKKYHYNYKHDEELSEENLRRTFINMSTKALFDRKQQVVREEKLNYDLMNSKEKEEVMFRMKKELEKFSQLPLDSNQFFTPLKQGSPLATQFMLWKKNLMIPLTDQLEEQAKRKMKEIEDAKIAEMNKDQAFSQFSQDDALYDLDAQKKKNERHQAILRQTIAEQSGQQLPESEKVKPDYASSEDPYKETIDKLPHKRKQKWRIF